MGALVYVWEIQVERDSKGGLVFSISMQPQSTRLEQWRSEIHAVLSSIYLHVVNTNTAFFLTGFNLSLTPPVYTPCLLDKAWLRYRTCPWYHHPLFRFWPSSLACLLCLAMWYFLPSHEATNKVFTRCCTDARPILLDFFFFLAYQKPNKPLCFINYPVFRITAFKRKRRRRSCWSARLRSLIWKVTLEKQVLTSSQGGKTGGWRAKGLAWSHCELVAEPGNDTKF